MRTGKTASMALAVLLATSVAASAADGCMTSVQSAMDSQRKAYIAAQSDMADQNYSRRPGTFASTTCLDRLMNQGGLDIFFKPPSLDSIVDMIKNFACEQASQIFGQLVGGGGIGGAINLNPGEIMPGVNLGGGAVSIGVQQGSGLTQPSSLINLFR